MSDPRTRNVAAVRRWAEAFTAGGFLTAEPLIDELFHPEIEFSPLLGRGVENRVCHGRDDVRAFFRELNETIADVRYPPSEVHAVTDEIVVLATRLIGRGRVSTAPVDQELGMLYEFEEGLVRRLTAYGSHAEAFDAAREVQRA